MPVTVSQTTLAIINQAEHDAAAVASTIAEIGELSSQLKAAQEALPGLQVAAQKSALAALHATMNELGVPPSVVIQSLAPPAAPAAVTVQASAKPA